MEDDEIETGDAEARRSALAPPDGAAAYVLRVSEAGVQFTRWHDGRLDETYPTMPPARAAIYAVAISQGFQPPRDLRPFDTPAG